MSHRRRWGRRRKPPAGWDYIEPVLLALDEEMKRVVEEGHEGKRKTESLWPVHQVNWQRSRYIYDLYYKYGKISRELFDYCLQEKIADAKLISWWKKPGYERLCSTYVINPKNYNFGTVSICRVPRQDLDPGKVIEDPFCGCRGCASGEGGYHNIFGNKYGQRLAAIQVKRELLQAERDAEEKAKKEAAERVWDLERDNAEGDEASDAEEEDGEGEAAGDAAAGSAEGDDDDDGGGGGDGPDLPGGEEGEPSSKRRRGAEE